MHDSKSLQEILMYDCDGSSRFSFMMMTGLESSNVQYDGDGSRWLLMFDGESSHI